MMGGSAPGGGSSLDFSGGQASGLAAIDPGSIGSFQASSNGTMSADEAAQYASMQGVPGFDSGNGGWGGSSSYTSAYPAGQSQQPGYSGQASGQPLLGPDGQPLLGPDGQPLMAGAATPGQPNIVINTSQPSTGYTGQAPQDTSGERGMSTGTIAGTSVGGAGALATLGLAGAALKNRKKNNAALEVATGTSVDQFGHTIVNPAQKTDSKFFRYGSTITVDGVNTIKKASTFRRYVMMNAQERAEYNARLAASQQKLETVQEKSMGLESVNTPRTGFQASPQAQQLQTPSPEIPQAPVDSDVMPYGSRILKDGKESIKVASLARQNTWSAKKRAAYQTLFEESERELIALQNYNVVTAARYKEAGLQPPPTRRIDASALPYGSLITKANGQESIKVASEARQLTWSKDEKDAYKKRKSASTTALKNVKKIDTYAPRNQPKIVAPAAHTMHGAMTSRPHVVNGEGLTTPVPHAYRLVPHNIQPARPTAQRAQMIRAR